MGSSPATLILSCNRILRYLFYRNGTPMITFHPFEVKFFFCAIYRMLFSEASPLSARPLPAFCVTVLIFTTLSLTFLILSYVKEPILSAIPPFPPLWNYLLAKSGCEPYVLKVYLGVLYLPFGIIFSLIIKSYEPFFAVVVYFIYQAIILFRRIRLLSRLLNKVYDLCSSDLGVREYVKRDYGHFVLSMMAFTHAVEKGWFAKGLNGLLHGILIPPLENPSVRANFKRKEQEYINSLLRSEEFQHLSGEDQRMALSSLRFVISGAYYHATIVAATEGGESVIVFPLTSLYNDRELALMIGHALTSISTKLVPLCERWSCGDATGKGQFMISGFGILRNSSTSWTMDPDNKRFNPLFFKEPN